ncbi:DUF2267 domain-containing protein [Winogradskya humida]|nr:DUF2267 domain-containing protein [Actinoplanes humidus]
MDVLVRIQKRARLHGPNETRRAISAILETLGDILPHHVLDQLAANFPDDLRPTSHMPPATAVPPGRNTFISRLATRLLIDEPDAAFLARVIFEQWNAAARTHTPATIAHLAPADLRPLLRAQTSPARPSTPQTPLAQASPAQASLVQASPAQISFAEVELSAELAQAASLPALTTQAPSVSAGSSPASTSPTGRQLNSVVPDAAEPAALHLAELEPLNLHPGGNEHTAVESVDLALDLELVETQREPDPTQADETTPARRAGAAPRRIVRVATNAASGHHQRAGVRQLSA